MHPSSKLGLMRDGNYFIAVMKMSVKMRPGWACWALNPIQLLTRWRRIGVVHPPAKPALEELPKQVL